MLRRLLASLLISIPLAAAAAGEVTDAWMGKTRLVLDTSPAGAALKSALPQYTVPVRLHTGNFPFTQAKPDGSDLRVTTADGKSVLPHQVEFWDATNELALVWVQVPTVAPGAKDQAYLIRYQNPDAPAAAKASVYDGRTTLAMHFAGEPANDAEGAVRIDLAGTVAQPQGVLGPALSVPAGAKLAVSGQGIRFSADGTTLQGWVRAAAPGTSGTLIRLAGAQTTVELTLEAGVPSVKVSGSATGSAAAAAPLSADDWHHLAVVVGERIALFVDGQEAGSVAAKVAEQPVDLVVGGGRAAFDLDELTLAAVARGPEWIRASVAAQGPDNKLVSIDAGEGGDEISHFSILIDNLTLDGKIVIYVLLAMFVIAMWVIVAKAIELTRIGRANAAFLDAFRPAGDEVFRAVDFDSGKRFAYSPLYQLFRTACEELQRRLPAGGAEPAIGPKTMGVIRAAIDATAVKQGNRLNKLIVLLTIAISGGPFIGLLGTVVGVMITFAAIAAIGDVNINSIAPGIAAALLATVAGLAVAIPALFAYNWLASRIKEISSEMQIFTDELTTRIAEAFER